MDLSPFGVRVSAGSLRRADGGVVLPHVWTDAGVATTPVSNGAQALHLAVALCVLNDTFREARSRDITLDGVAVTADGALEEDWRSTGITYSVELATPASPEERAALLAVVDEAAEIPRALRSATTVTRR